MVDKYGFWFFIYFGMEVMDVKFQGGKWCIVMKLGQIVIVDVVVSGLGGLYLFNKIDFEGCEMFCGEMFYIVEWFYEFDLMGKKVVMIGMGVSVV